MKAGKDANDFTCIQDGECDINTEYFEYDNAFDACYTTGYIIWLKAQFEQTVVMHSSNLMFFILFICNL